MPDVTTALKLPETSSERIALCVKDSVIDTFGAILGAAPVYRDLPAAVPQHELIIGIISLVGDASVSILLALPRNTATQFSARFAGFQIDFEGPDMGDVVGEIANVLAGDVVARLDALEIKTQMSLPTVVRGHSIEVLFPETVDVSRLHFDCTQGDFLVEIVRSRWGIHRNG